MPNANAEAMNEHLKEISSQVSTSAHAMLLLDQAGWHQTRGRLDVPDNITLVPLEVDPTYGTSLARCLATAPVRLPSFLLSS
jgi:hypothetical protein